MDTNNQSNNSNDITPGFLPENENPKKSESKINQECKKQSLENFLEEKIGIKLELSNNEIILKIKYKNEIYNCIVSLKELQEKDNYFKSFKSIEEAFNEIYNCIDEDKYTIKKEINNLILIIEINKSETKNVISFILDRNQITNEDKIKNLYILTNKYIKENNELKEDINLLKNKIDSMEKMISYYFNNKIHKEKIKERKSIININDLYKISKIISRNDLLKLKNWLPYNNIDYLKIKLIYDAKWDGDTAKIFHSLCRNVKNTITFIYTSDDKRIGCYLSQNMGYKHGRSIIDENAFLFNLDNNEKYMARKNCGVFFDYEDEGPQFGDNISIKDNCLTSYNNFYGQSNYYFDFKNKKKDTKHYFKVNELEVFQICD